MQTHNQCKTFTLRAARDEILDLHDMAIAVLEATLGGSPNIVASVGFVVALLS